MVHASFLLLLCSEKLIGSLLDTYILFGEDEIVVEDNRAPIFGHLNNKMECDILKTVTLHTFAVAGEIAVSSVLVCF